MPACKAGFKQNCINGENITDYRQSKQLQLTCCVALIVQKAEHNLLQ